MPDSRKPGLQRGTCQSETRKKDKVLNITTRTGKSPVKPPNQGSQNPETYFLEMTGFKILKSCSGGYAPKSQLVP